MAASVPDHRVLLVALLYSVGAHGIMTLNDFKSVEGDGRTGIRSLPVQLGTLGAARLACLVMAVPQVAVILGLFAWDRPWHGTVIGLLLLGQLILMRRLLAAPRERAAWYNGTSTTLYVLGMLVAAFALRPLVQGGP